MAKIKEIKASAYELKAVAPIISTHKHESRKGALLKVQFADGLVGYADCHPWPEIGDIPILEQLKTLKEGRTTPLTSRSLYFARLDAEARDRKVSLFENLSIPPNHLFLGNLSIVTPETLKKAMKEEGHTRFKFKIDKEYQQQAAMLKALLSHFKPTDFRVHLDFNSKLTEQEFADFIYHLGQAREYIDFFEDPFPFDPKSWSHYQKNGFIFACDYKSKESLGLPEEAVYVVMKPAIQEESSYLQKLHPKQKLIVTSYLDHPLGQMSAAYTAAQCYKKLGDRLKSCGLLTHTAYYPDPFIEQLKVVNSCLQPVHGTGLGFDDLLAKQPWKSL